ncbi:MAG: hypothetical protein DDT35_01334 [Firmicutes bacterium]|nr:hypothetical protein [Bacillota bacterium]
MNWTAIWKALLIQMLAKNELMDAIRSLHQMPERFPFLEDVRRNRPHRFTALMQTYSLNPTCIHLERKDSQ